MNSSSPQVSMAMREAVARWFEGGREDQRGLWDVETNSLMDALAPAIAAMQSARTPSVDEVREFAAAVPPHSDGCPWCDSKEHWSGQVQGCPSHSSRFVADLLHRLSGERG